MLTLIFYQDIGIIKTKSRSLFDYLNQAANITKKLSRLCYQLDWFLNTPWEEIQDGVSFRNNKFVNIFYVVN